MSKVVEVVVEGGLTFITPDKFNVSVKVGSSSFEDLKSSIASKIAQETTLELGYLDDKGQMITICNSTSLTQAFNQCAANAQIKIVARFKDTLPYICELQDQKEKIGFLENKIEILEKENAALKAAAGTALRPLTSERPVGGGVDNMEVIMTRPVKIEKTERD